MTSEAEFKEELQDGRMIETREEMTEGYESALRTILKVSGDTELMSVPAYLDVSLEAPTMDARASCMGVIQDEIGHGHIAYRLLENLGEDTRELVHGREPHEWRNTYGFDQYIDDFAELVCAHGLFDRAGIVLLADIHENTSYAPWKRALTKVSKEEQFHLRHGETWMRRLANHSPRTRRKVQEAVDWMFPITVEWFGLPDDKKKHFDQIEYRIKGLTNDELRQKWMESIVPLCEEIDVDVPAHYDDEEERYVLEYDLPVAFDEEGKEWRFDEPITWSDVLDRWKARGPANEEYVRMIQDGVLEVAT